MVLVAGVDGCKAGWFVVYADPKTKRPFRWECITRLAEIMKQPEKPSVVAVDIPIGLLSSAQRGGRECDIAARKLLGSGRASSVFPPPSRPALAHPDDYRAASDANRRSSSDGIGISKQCFSIIPKISEVDDFIDPTLQVVVKEIHPEVCFWLMAGQRPNKYAKKTAAGKEERLRLLEGAGFGGIRDAISEFPRSMVQVDDVLDAAAACWTACRIASNQAIRVPAEPSRDEKGLLMEMWV